jgi:hypothetical protein
MKARITLVFATAVLALAVAGGALAAPQQSGIASWSHSPLGATVWTSYSPTEIKPWDVNRPSAHPDPCASRCPVASKPDPMSIRLVKPNPTCIRGAAKGW